MRYTMLDRLQMSCALAFLAVCVWLVPEHIANRLAKRLAERVEVGRE